MWEVILMKNKSNKKHTKTLKAFETAPFVDIDKRIHDSRVAIPREQAVLDAKDWVDNNEK
jgi:hypothetical protein